MDNVATHPRIAGGDISSAPTCMDCAEFRGTSIASSGERSGPSHPAGIRVDTLGAKNTWRQCEDPRGSVIMEPGALHTYHESTRTLCCLTLWDGEDIVNEDQCVLLVLWSDCAMLKIQQDEAIVIETGDHDQIFSVAFQSDGMQLFSGNDTGIRRWRVADGQEVGNQMGMNLRAISVSRDGKWIVCGTRKGASVWDATIQERAIEVEGTEFVGAVDISPDSTRFATAAGGHKASTWNIITGERLVGPLQHDGYIAGIKFSPNGEHVATAVEDCSIRVFDSRNGDQLITIKTDIPSLSSLTPLAWSNNGQLRLGRSLLTHPPDPNWLNRRFKETEKSCLSL